MEAVKLENVSFTYPEAERKALDNISLTISAGELVLLCGRSGSGKSTLLRLLKKQLSPHGDRKGSIYIFEKPIEDQSETQAVTLTGCVMQNCDGQLAAESVWRELAFGAESLGMSSSQIRLRCAETSVYFGIDRLYRRSTSSLSGGEKQLVNLSSVMVCRPQLLLLDEPAAQLDPIAAKNFIADVIRLNRELGLTVIISEHHSDDIFPYADRVISLEKGRLTVNNDPRKAAADRQFFFGALPTPAKLFFSINENRERSADPANIPLTTAQCREYLTAKANFKAEINTEKNTKAYCEPIIKIKNVRFRYQRNSDDILRDLSLEIYKGEVLCILGGNGAGKSTLLRILAGIEKPYSGSIKINGKNLSKKHGGSLKTALLPQSVRELFLYPTVREEITEAAKAGDVSDEEAERRFSSAVSALDIEHLLSCHPYDLSGGEQQRAALAKLLALQPQLLLLDEPTKGMDCEGKEQFAEMIKELSSKGITSVIVTHDVRTAAACADRCALLFDGEITASGTPTEFFSSLSYYTTPEARISRGICENAVTLEQIKNVICTEGGCG